MCTAVSYAPQDHYFGRNLDLEYTYQECVTITPQNFLFSFRCIPAMPTHYAMIGMATVADNFPLYYEATNEKGLSIAGLNFPGNAAYLPVQTDKINIAPFELIPYLLGQCDSVAEVLQILPCISIAHIPFSDQYPLSPLHWIVADRKQAITVEAMEDGLHFYDNPVGVLTNNPPFDFHLYNLRNYLNVSAEPAVSKFSDDYNMQPYSNGMGGLGLPGDYSSASRFVRAAFVKLNSVSGSSEAECVHQFFHILSSVAMPRGCVQLHPGKYEITQYSCCCNTDRGIYYYRTYENGKTVGIDLHQENLSGSDLVCFPLQAFVPIEIQNRYNKDGDN